MILIGYLCYNTLPNEKNVLEWFIDASPTLWYHLLYCHRDIYLSKYNIFSFIIYQISYLKGYQCCLIHMEVLVRIRTMLLNNKCEMNWPSRTKIWFCCMRMSYADSIFPNIFATDKMQAWSWSKQSSTVTEIPDKSMSLPLDLQIFQFLQEEG